MNEIIETERLILKILDEKDADRLLDFLIENRADFTQYESEKQEIYFTRYYQEYVLKMEYEAIKNKMYLRYYLFEKGQEEIVGTVSVSQIKAYPYSSGYIGYKMAVKKKRRGYATEAVEAVCEEAEKYLGLHRLEAYVLEDNIPSIKLLERCGFLWEGTCRKNLNINGVWRDHLLYGKLLERNEA